MGQVWSSADFDGVREQGHHGGCGSVLAVTSQNLGRDGKLGTADDEPAPLNGHPVSVSLDASPDDNCSDMGDRVRNFYGFHPDGAFFVLADGSVHFVSESIEPGIYQALSTINGGEVAAIE